MKYFDHDTSAHKDDKVVLLRQRHGGAAVDAYWTILEYMYREETQIKPKKNPSVLPGLAFFLMVSVDDLKEWVNSMCELGLLESEADNGDLVISSPRAQATIDGYQNRVLVAKSNGRKGGRPPKNKGKAACKNHSGFSEKPNETQVVSEIKPRQNQAETEAKPDANPEKPEGEGEGEGEEKKKTREKEKPDGRARAAFVKACLDVFNEETGSQIAYVDPETQMRLRIIQDTGRTLEDVRLVTKDKFSEWKDDPKMSKFIRPKTFFGDQFESYLATARRKDAKRAEKEGRYAKYA